MGFLKTIFIILIVYYAIKLITRYLFPFFIRHSINRFAKKYGEHYDEPKPKKEGEVSIEYKPKKKRKLDDIGEYVDYKEIND